MHDKGKVIFFSIYIFLRLLSLPRCETPTFLIRPKRLFGPPRPQYNLHATLLPGKTRSITCPHTCLTSPLPHLALASPLPYLTSFLSHLFLHLTASPPPSLSPSSFSSFLPHLPFPHIFPVVTPCLTSSSSSFLLNLLPTSPFLPPASFFPPWLTFPCSSLPYSFRPNTPSSLPPSLTYRLVLCTTGKLRSALSLLKENMH